MPKRIALFLLGLAVVLGAFFLYQYIMGPDPMSAHKGTVAPTTGPTTLPLEVVVSDENGVMQYVITASSAPVALKDPQGNILPGQFLMLDPLATFFDKSGRVIQVRADKCQVVIDQGPKGGNHGLAGSISGPAGGKMLDTMTVREGQLQGHVRMVINPRASLAAAKAGATAPATDANPAAAIASAPAPAPAMPDLLAGGLRIYLDEDLHLDGIQEVLKTTGGLHVRSDNLAFDGRGMELVFDRKAQAIDYLQIENGNQVIVRGVGSKALTFGNPSTAPVSRPGTALTGTAATPAATLASTQPAKTPTTYRLSFGQDVKVMAGVDPAVAKSGSTLTSDRLYLIFMGGGDLADASNPAATTTKASATHPTNVAPPLASASVSEMKMAPDPEPIAPPTANDLVVQWTGPMELRPADDKDQKLRDSHDVALEATGTAAKPVSVSDPRFTAQAGRLWYHQAEQRIDLEPEDFGRVTLHSPDHGDVDCQKVSIDQIKNTIKLDGPGALVSIPAKPNAGAPAKANSNEGPVRVTWTTQMDIDLETALAAGIDKKSTFPIRHALIHGAGITTSSLDFTTDELDVLIANVADDKGKPVQAVEHMDAKGNVVVNSFHTAKLPAGADIAAVPERVPQGGLKSDHLEIFSAKAQGSNIPDPSQMIADGNVESWRLIDKSQELKIDPKDLKANPDLGIQKETITAARMVTILAPKPKTPAGSQPATEPALAVENGLSGIMQDIPVSHMVASQGVKIEIKPPAASKTLPIVATANMLDAYPDRDKAHATLSAGDAPGDLVHVSIGENAIQGRTVLLDQNARTFQVPGPGTFKASLPPEDKAKLPVPLVVVWQDSMNYDDKKHLATFTGKPVARMPRTGSLDDADQARLSCEKTLVVQLKTVPTNHATGVTSAPAIVGALVPASAPAGRAESPTDLLDSSVMALDWMEATGKVEAFGAQVGDNDKLLKRLRLSAIDTNTKPATLRYSETDHDITVDGPGAMVVENFEADKPGDRTSTAGESTFGWQKSFNCDNANGKIVFTGDVKFIFNPAKPFKFNAGATPASSAGTAPLPEQVFLQTERLVATLAKPKETSPPDAATKPAKRTVDSPIGLGAGGNQELSTVETTGGTQFDVGTLQIVGGPMKPVYHIAGANMTFDVPSNLATIRGAGDEPVVIDEIATGRRATGRVIHFDMTKDKLFFSGEGIQGNLAGLGQ